MGSTSHQDILVAMDWTNFDHDDQATLVLGLVTGHGWASEHASEGAPLLWLTVWKEELKNRRNDYEDACLRRLSELVPPACRDSGRPWLRRPEAVCLSR